MRVVKSEMTKFLMCLEKSDTIKVMDGEKTLGSFDGKGVLHDIRGLEKTNDLSRVNREMEFKILMNLFDRWGKEIENGES